MGFSFAMLAWVDFLLFGGLFLQLNSASLDYFPLPHKMLFIGAALSGDQHPVFGIGHNGSDNVCPLRNYGKFLCELFDIFSHMTCELIL